MMNTGVLELEAFSQMVYSSGKGMDKKEVGRWSQVHQVHQVLKRGVESLCEPTPVSWEIHAASLKPLRDPPNGSASP